MNSDFNLSVFLKETDANGALIVNLKGEVIEFENVDESNNIGGMMGVMLKMVSEFTSDVGIGDLKQILFKAEEGIFIINKLDEENVLGVYSKDIGKAGLVMMSINKLIKN